MNSFFADLSVLLWRDVRVFRNTTRSITREPLRMLGWVVWIGYIAYRLIAQHTTRMLSPAASLDAMDIGGAILLLVMSLSLVRGEQPPVPFFSSASEARWLSNAHLETWITTFYLQLRNAVARFPSMMLFLAYIITICPPSRNPLVAAVGIATVVAMLLLTRLFAMPREFAPPWLKLLMVVSGLTLGCIALIAVAQSLLSAVSFQMPILAAIPKLHIGLLFIAAISGNIQLGFAAFFLVAIAFLTGTTIARNRYPELYELSVAGWEARRKFRDGRFSHNEDQTTAKAMIRHTAIPSGAAAQLWVNWLMYRRDQPLWWIIVRPLLALTLGFLCIATHNSLIDVVRAFGSLILLTTMFSSAIDAKRIGKELRRTVCWLTDTNFRTRLAMIVLGWYWRSAGDLTLFALGTLVAGSSPGIVLSFWVIALSGVWLQRCISAAAFALLPNKTDLGGPTYLVHVMLMILFMAPPIICGTVLFEFKEPLVLLLIVCPLVTIAESYILLSFAAKRLRGRFDLVVSY